MAYGVTGRSATMAFGVLGNNSWGVPTSVTRRIYFESDAGMTSRVNYVDDRSFGQTFLAPADVGDFEPIDVTLTGQQYYDHWTHWLEAVAMASPAAPAVVSSVAANSLIAYQHVVDLAGDNNGRAITVASDKVNFVEEITSAKIYGFGFGVGTGGVITSNYKLMGSKSTNSSAVNTRSAVAASPVAPALQNRIFRDQGTIRMNLQSAGSLVAADALADVTEVTFDFTRPLDPALVYGQDYTIEPLDNGFPDINLTLRFARATTVSTNSFYAVVQSGQAFKGDITFTGAYINSTTQRSMKLEFPHLEPVGPFEMAITGAEQVRPSITFKAKLAATSPNGMAFVNPFRLTRVSVNSTAAF